MRTIIETGLYNIVFEGPDEAALSFAEATSGRAGWDRAWHAAETCMRVHAYVARGERAIRRSGDYAAEPARPVRRLALSPVLGARPRLLAEAVLRPFAPEPDDVRILYLAAALAPHIGRTATDRKGKSFPYASVVLRDQLKVGRWPPGFARALVEAAGPDRRRKVVVAVASWARPRRGRVIHDAAVHQGHCQCDDRARGGAAMASASGRRTASLAAHSGFVCA